MQILVRCKELGTAHHRCEKAVVSPYLQIPRVRVIQGRVHRFEKFTAERRKWQAMQYGVGLLNSAMGESQ